MLVTVDINLEYQQNPSNWPIAVVVLRGLSNDINDLRPLMPQVRTLLPDVKPGRLYRVGPGS